MRATPEYGRRLIASEQIVQSCHVTQDAISLM